jgi:effector-binding domain-containing protein
MEYGVRLETLGPRPLAVVRRRASLKDLPKVVPDACGVVWKVIRAKGVAGAGRHIALYLDDQINLEVGVELEAPLGDRGGGELIGSATPAGLVATAVHFGPYGGLHAAHHAIRQWCAAHGHTTAGPNWETYGHWLDAWTNNPSQIRTDVFYQLKSRGNAG